MIKIKDKNILINEDREDRMTEGAKQKQIETAKRMIKENLEIDLIARVSGLSKE